jgi:6-phosphogluconolactonase
MRKTLSIFMLASASALSLPAFAGGAEQTTASDTPSLLFASLGEKILGYRVDPQAASLTYLSETSAPTNVQFAVKNAKGTVLYVVSSNAGNGTLGAKGDVHVLDAYRIDPDSGKLTLLPGEVRLPERPINLAIDRAGHFAVVAYNQSATLSVHPIGADGGVNDAVVQRLVPQAGIFTHQVTLTPDNHTVIALARGNDAVGPVPDQPGSIESFKLDDQGHLTKVNVGDLDPGIGPRHLAYHPIKPWVYMAMERGSKLYMYTLDKGGLLSAKPLFKKETLANLADIDTPRQRGGVIQVSPNGKYIYVSNRADATVPVDGKAVSAGGENNIAVFAINPRTGEPTLIQHIDGHGIEGRTLKVDPSGKLLIVANQKTLWVETGGTLDKVRANLAVFRIGDDGKLTFVHGYEMTDEKKSLLWMDI